MTSITMVVLHFSTRSRILNAYSLVKVSAERSLHVQGCHVAASVEDMETQVATANQLATQKTHRKCTERSQRKRRRKIRGKGEIMISTLICRMIMKVNTIGHL